MRLLRTALAVAITGLALSACGDLPRPFAHDPDRAASGLSRLSSGAGVAVLLPAEDEGPADAARAVSAALRALDVPAESVDAPREGAYTVQPGARGTWELYSPTGRLLHSVPPDAAPEDAARALAWAVENDAARPLPQRLAEAQNADDGASNAAPANAPLPAVRVLLVEGVTPDRARMMTGAVEEALRRAGIEVSATADWTVAGRLETAPVPEGQPVPVRLTWTVLAPDGTSRGTAEQINAVPPQALADGFAALAAAASPGAAEGVAAILAEAR